mgnify:FL=1
MGKEKVILAYSGGLDTTAIIPWLKETYNFDVVCVCIDVGQESELEASTREPNIQELRSSTFWMSLMNSVMSTSFQV